MKPNISAHILSSIIVVFVAATFALSSGLISANAQQDIASRQVTVDPAAVEVSKWEGWGASLCWWAVASEKWPDTRTTEICRRIFSAGSDSLGLNICRYNAGGTSTTADIRAFRPGGAVRSLINESGSFDARRDRGQLNCLSLAKRFGADTFEIFVNSPPSWMLKNGNTRGGANGSPNLKPECVGAYVAWLLSTARGVQKSTGVNFQWLAPFNEPSSSWWNPVSQGQEGCAIPGDQQARIVTTLRRELNKQKSAYKVSASDENGAHEAFDTLNTLRANGKDALPDKLNVHAYTGWEWQDRLRELTANTGIPHLWMSEVTYRESGPQGFFPNSIRAALPVSRSIANDIHRLHCSAWVYWQPAEPLEYCKMYGYTYGLIQTVFDPSANTDAARERAGGYVVSRAFWAMRQHTAFIRPGDTLVSCGDFWSIAAISADRSAITIVVHNDTAQALRYKFDLTKFISSNEQAARWRTADLEDGTLLNCASIPPLIVQSGRYTDLIPPLSVTTYRVQLTGVRRSQ